LQKKGLTLYVDFAQQTPLIHIAIDLIQLELFMQPNNLVK